MVKHYNTQQLYKMHKKKQTKCAKSIRKMHKEQADLWEMNKKCTT